MLYKPVMPALVVSILFLILCSCSDQSKEMGVIDVVSVSQSQYIDIPIKFKRGPLSLIVQLEGELGSDASLKLLDEDGLNDAYHLNKGKISLRINKEWYSQIARLSYESSKKNEGYLKVKYHVDYRDDFIK